MKNRHILFIDPIEKLNYKKDSSLLLSLTLKKRGFETYLLFEKNFHITNGVENKTKVYNFSGNLEESFYIENYMLKEEYIISWRPGDIIHMRIDPPFDKRYLQYLWMLGCLEKKKVKIINSVHGILCFNEKLAFLEKTLPSFIGSSVEEFSNWVDTIKEHSSFLIAKPLNLYQGIGVEKWSIDKNLHKKFRLKVKKNNGPIMVQRFFDEITQGEVRSIFFKKKEIGSILKVPQKGKFLANIVNGADYSPCYLSEKQSELCRNISSELSSFGIDLVAFDLLGDHVSEANITCPGLLVEVSSALGKNLAEKIIDALC